MGGPDEIDSLDPIQARYGFETTHLILWFVLDLEPFSDLRVRPAYGLANGGSGWFHPSIFKVYFIFFSFEN